MILSMSLSSALSLAESFASETIHVTNDVPSTVDDACIRFTMLNCLVVMLPTRFHGEPDFGLIDRLADRLPSYMIEDLDNFKCDNIIIKQLASCEHTAELPCSTDVLEHRCTRSCAGIMGCCGRTCGSSCSDCQAENQAGEILPIERKLHRQHLCKKPLYCGHECPLPCSRDHACTTMCREACRQRCAHSSCSAYCSNPCEPCKEVCTW